MRVCSSPSSPTAHIAFCTLDDVLRPQIFSMHFSPKSLFRIPGAAQRLSGAPQNRDPGCYEDWSRIGGASLRAAPRPGHKPLLQPPRFFRQHDRDAVADRIGELGRARDQLLPLRVVFQRALGERTDEDLQQLRIDAAGGPFDGRDGGHASLSFVMPGLVPGIHVLFCPRVKTWMAGTSPAMTVS